MPRTDERLWPERGGGVREWPPASDRSAATNLVEVGGPVLMCGG